MSFPDHSFLTKRMIMGGHIDSLSKARCLLGLGVTHVVSTLWIDEPHQDEEWLEALYGDVDMVGYRPAYVHAPIADDHLPKEVEWFGVVVPFVLKALACPGTRVYGHCAAGRSRSGLLWYAVFRALGFGSEESEGMIVRARPEATFWPEYRRSAETALYALGYA